MIKNSTQPVLLQKLFELLERHRSAFGQERIYWRVVGMILGEVFNFGRHYEKRKVAKVFFIETLAHTSVAEP